MPASLFEDLTKERQKDVSPSGAPSMFEDLSNKSDGSNLVRGVKESFQQIPQLGYGVLAGIGAGIESVAGEGGIGTGLKTAGVEGYNRWGEKIAAGSKESDSWDYSWDQAKQGNFGALVDWLAHGIGYTGGQGIQMLVGAGIGSMVGKATLGTVAESIAQGLVKKEALRIAEEEVAKSATKIGASEIAARAASPEVIKAATSSVASTIGQTSAVAASSFAQEGGEIFGDLVSTAQKEGRQLSGAELGKAFAASLAAGGLEFVGDKLGLDVILGRSKLLKPAETMTGLGGRAARAGLATAAQAPVEGATEYLQTGLEQYGKGEEANILPFNQSPEGQKQARESAALGILGGVVMGGAGGALQGPKKPAQEKPQEEPPKPPLLLPAPTGILGSSAPRPVVQFQDGTYGTVEDAQNYINAKVAAAPPEQQANVRQTLEEQLLGIGRPKPTPAEIAAKTGGRATAADILDADISAGIDEAIELAQRAVGYRTGLAAIDVQELSIPTLTDVLDGQGLMPEIPVGQASEADLASVRAPLLPVGEATEMLPVGEATEIEDIPAGQATDLTTGATEEWAKADQALQREVDAARINRILDGDMLTKDGMPYGSKTAALLRAKREGLSLDHVIEIPNAGWVVRPNLEIQVAEQPNMQPVTGQPSNAPGFTAENVPGMQPQTPGVVGGPTGETNGQVQGQGGQGQEVAQPPTAGGAITGGAAQPEKWPDYITTGDSLDIVGYRARQPGETEINTGGHEAGRFYAETEAGTGGYGYGKSSITEVVSEPIHASNVLVAENQNDALVDLFGYGSEEHNRYRMAIEDPNVVAANVADKMIAKGARDAGYDAVVYTGDTNLWGAHTRSIHVLGPEPEITGGAEQPGGGKTEPKTPEQPKVEGEQPKPPAEPKQTPAPQEEPKTTKAVQPKPNTIFTEEAASKARELLRKKLGQVSSGIDPEVLQAGITLAGYHIEKGARTFAAYAKAMIADLGEVVKPYLKSWYMGVKYDPMATSFSREMDDEAAINAAEGWKQSYSLKTPEGRAAIAREVADHFLDGKSFDSIVDARKFIAELTGERVEPASEASKMADEAIETGVVMASRDIVVSARHRGWGDERIFDRLQDLYEQQPNLSSRSSTSIREQAYSTPVPLAFLASRLAQISQRMRVGEPTGGNGMLLLEVDPKNAVVNELNPTRLESLRSQGFEPTQNDAATTALAEPGSLDAVVMNPPFGAVKDAAGDTIYYQIAPNITTREVDHAIALEALKSLSDDGNAVLILGGVDARSEDHLREGYRGKNKREFYFTLYSQYNVVDHFTVDGDLYTRQGAGYPVDVIVIRGRGKATRMLPAAELPNRLMNWEQVKEKLNVEYPVVPQGSRPATGSSARPGWEGNGTAVVAGPGGSGITTGSEPAGPAGGPTTGVTSAGSGGSGEPIPGGTVSGGAQPGTAAGTGGSPTGSVVSVPGERGPAAGAGAPGNAGNGTGNVAGSGQRTGDPVEPGLSRKDLRGTEEAGTTQAQYEPKSAVPSVGTLVPVNMRDAIQSSLAKIAHEVGDLDKYVAEKLDYEHAELGRYFSAEQVDALALAIYNAEKNSGFIIGDQTGVGKGRVVAGMIKYALRNGRTPIFVTEKPNLYADMIRDLDDIGLSDELGLATKRSAIFMTNSDERVPYTLSRNVGGEIVESNFELAPAASQLGAIMGLMIERGSVDPYKVIFTTYNQLQTVQGKTTSRMRFMQSLGPRSYLVLDESHNAGGNTATQARTKQQRDAQKAGLTAVTGRAAFLRGLVRMAKGSFFSSATYAKRPEVMDLYSSTNMMLAVNNPSELAPAIKRGGVPMQQIVATMLTDDGQYIRRERSFAGVTYDTRETVVDKDVAENMASSMRQILAVSRAKEAAVKSMQKELDKAGAKTQVEGERTQVQGANFGAIMHNLIDQMLLALKAQDTVGYAIERLKAGEKVVLTVSNTMGSFLNSYADEMGLRPGDPMLLSFKDLYLRYLEKQRWVKIKHPGGRVDSYRLTDHDLGPQVTAMFTRTARFIENAGFANAPISPIDYMHQQLRAAGYKTDEITGRSIGVNYAEATPSLMTRKASIRQRLAAIKGFNGGTVDALILNQSGATGLSLHASEKFKDQRRRHMIIVQAEKNIDTHVQLLGRVLRTGQVVTPTYTQAMADIPAEMRPAAILAKKMASLSANTTASRKSAVSAENVVDFMNDYGGQVAAEFLSDNPDLHQMLGGQKVLPIPDSVEQAKEDDIRRLTGYIPVLPIAQQEQIYADLISRYNELIERENSIGSNMLEARALDLDAQTLSTEALTPQKDGNSRFAAPALMERIDAKRTVKPFTGAEVQAAVDAGLAGKTPEEFADQMVSKLQEEANTYIGERLAKLTEAGAPAERLEHERNLLQQQLTRAVDLLRTFPVGSSIVIPGFSDTTYGVITKIEHIARTANPAAGSSWKVTLALANGDAKGMTIHFGQIGEGRRFEMRVENGNVPIITPEGEVAMVPIREIFDQGAHTRREKRWMVTGNILAGYAQFGGFGQIVTYTKNDGSTGQGVLMPKYFDFGKEKEKQATPFATTDQVMEYLRRVVQAIGRGLAWTEDRSLRVAAGHGGFDFIVPSSKREGGKFFLDRGLTSALGQDFYKAGSIMRASVNESRAREAIDYLLANGTPLFSDKQHANVAKAVMGIGVQEQGKSSEENGLGGRARMSTGGTGIGVDRAQEIADSVSAAWASGPEIKVVDTEAELPQSALDEIQRLVVDGAARPSGFFDPSTGAIYMVASNIKSDAEAVKVLLHEAVGHFGMRAVFGADFAKVLDSFSTIAEKRVREMADRLGYDFDNIDDRRAAAEEVLAYMAETNPSYGWVRKIVATIAKWLRSVFPDLSLTDSEIIRDFIVPARAWVASGRTPPKPAPKTSASDVRFRMLDALRKAGGGPKIVGNVGRQYTPRQLRGMRNTGMLVDKPTLEDRVKDLWSNLGRKIEQGVFDQFAPIQDIDRHAYSLLRLAKGAAGAFQTMLQGGMLKIVDGSYAFDPTRRGGVIERLLKPLQGEHHDFLRWVAANRADQLTQEDREHLFSEQDIEDLRTLADDTTTFDYTLQHNINGRPAGTVTRDRTLIYADAAKTLDEFNKMTLDMAEESGLIDGESRQFWEKEFYVPFYRVADESEGGVRGTNIKSGVVRQEAFKHLKGGTQKLNADLMDNVLMNWAHLLDASAKNRAAKATLDALVDAGHAFESTETAARQAAKSMGVKDHVVWIKDGGTKHFYVVDDPAYMMALTSLEYAGLRGTVMDVMGGLKHAITVGVTASPFFKVRNLIRDSIQSIATSPIGVNPLTNVAEGWKLSNQTSDSYLNLLASGGTIHFGTMLEGSESRRIQALVESGIQDNTILNSDQKYRAFYRKHIEPWLTAYNELGNRGETVNRASLYDQLRKQGLSHTEASIQARDLMDFSMQGTWTAIRFLAQVVPFFNARLQGLYKLKRAAQEDPKRFAAVVGATAAASVMLLLAYSDDDDWRKREDWDRNNFWWFKIGGTAFRIPKPFEVGAIATLAERGFELFFDREMTGKRFRANVLNILSDQLNMDPIPQIAKPMLGVYANVDGYTGRPIETEGQKNLAPEYRFNSSTSMTARAASTGLNTVASWFGGKSLSPVQVDYLIQGYFAWLGTFVVQAADIVARPITDQPERPSRDWLKTATGGMLSDLNDAQSRYVSQMYDQGRVLEQAYHTYRTMLREGKVADTTEYLQEHREEISKYRQLERAKSAETKLNLRQRQIENDSTMSAEQKRNAIREILLTRERIAKPVTEAIQ